MRNMMNLSKEINIHFLIIGAMFVFLGIVLSHPFEFNWQSVFDNLSQLSNVWWRIALLICVLTAVAFILSRKNHQVIAEHIGAFAAFVLFSPLIIILSGLPKDLGLIGLLFLFGVLMVIASLSKLLSIILLNATKSGS